MWCRAGPFALTQTASRDLNLRLRLQISLLVFILNSALLFSYCRMKSSAVDFSIVCEENKDKIPGCCRIRPPLSSLYVGQRWTELLSSEDRKGLDQTDSGASTLHGLIDQQRGSGRETCMRGDLCPPSASLSSHSSITSRWMLQWRMK